MSVDKIKQRVNVLEKRIVKLEKAAMLFEVHRQSWLRLNKELKKMHQEMEREKRERLKREKREQRKRVKRLKSMDLADDPALFDRVRELAR